MMVLMGLSVMPGIERGLTEVATCKPSVLDLVLSFPP